MEQTVTVENSKLFGKQLPVPSKEHFTFNGCYIKGQDKTKPVTDRNGVINSYNLQLDNAVLLSSRTANETITYKILMVYVTEIHAVLPTCIIAENRTRVVDEYFTTQPITTENFYIIMAVMVEMLQYILCCLPIIVSLKLKPLLRTG